MTSSGLSTLYLTPACAAKWITTSGFSSENIFCKLFLSVISAFSNLNKVFSPSFKFYFGFNSSALFSNIFKHSNLYFGS